VEFNRYTNSPVARYRDELYNLPFNMNTFNRMWGVVTPEQAAAAAKTVKPKVLFPYHYGQTDVSGIPAQLENEGVEVRIRHYE